MFFTSVVETEQNIGDYLCASGFSVPPLQVFSLKTASKYPLNAKLLQQDCWGLKKLFTYGCRKAGFGKPGEKSPNRRELWFLFSLVDFLGMEERYA